tara:strand:+ start:108798 stop:110780 length:1983 start_codon:yes stop_codon:yes gene_type:complete
VGSAASRSGTLPEATPALLFNQGVASGDPRPDAIMLWTRAVPVAAPAASEDSLAPANSGQALHVLLQMSSTPDFKEIVLQQTMTTDADSDYTVRAFVQGLAADTHYYYRFIGGQRSVSRTGRTRTAPDPSQAASLKLAFASCQSYEQAYYGSWARMIADDEASPVTERIQCVLHLGDFIYERSWHLRRNGERQTRYVPDFPDGLANDENRHAVSLADYRHLYQTYLGDPHLQEARARWPFICVWDDHEYSNDNFQSYSTYGEEPVLDAPRKLDANQAWFEYIPCILDQIENQPAHDFRHTSLPVDPDERNRAAVDSLCIYRSLRWGRDIDIVLTDSRSYRSAPCLTPAFTESLGLPMNTVDLVTIADGGRACYEGSPPAVLPYGVPARDNPFKAREPGTLLGEQQRAWFIDTLSSSDARWKVWGNALPLLPMRLDLSALPLAGLHDSIFNIDAWSGYPHEVALIMRALREQGVSGLVSLSGDHHMHGAGTISWSTTALDATPVCADFNVAGISSAPLFEELYAVAKAGDPAFHPIVFTFEDDELVPVWNMAMLQGVFPAYTYSKTGLKKLAQWLGPNRANPGLRYVDTQANGYGIAHFTTQQVEVDLVTMHDCRTPFEAAPPIKHTARFTLGHWQEGTYPQLQGPTFTGVAPFPFDPTAA